MRQVNRLLKRMLPFKGYHCYEVQVFQWVIQWGCKCHGFNVWHDPYWNL